MIEDGSEYDADVRNILAQHAARAFAKRIDEEMMGRMVRAAVNAPKPTRWKSFKMNCGRKWRSFWSRLIPGRLQAAMYAWKHYGEEDYE